MNRTEPYRDARVRSRKDWSRVPEPLPYIRLQIHHKVSHLECLLRLLSPYLGYSWNGF